MFEIFQKLFFKNNFILLFLTFTKFHLNIVTLEGAVNTLLLVFIEFYSSPGWLIIESE